MRYRRLGHSKLEVSVISLGTWGIGGEFFGETDDKKSIEAIQTAIDEGINLIDTAPAYGGAHAEKIVGKAIEGRKDKCIIATKVGVTKKNGKFVKDLSKEAIRKQIDGSLKRLNLDTIPLYQIHWPDPDTPFEESMEELVRQHKKGKFRYLGVSNFSIKQIEEAKKYLNVISLQPKYSLLDRGIEEEIIPYCIASNVGILSYGTIAGGALTQNFAKHNSNSTKKDNRSDFYNLYNEPMYSKVHEFNKVLDQYAIEYDKTIAQIAINWVTLKVGITSAIVGARTKKHVLQNVEAADEILSREDFLFIDKKYDKIFSNKK